MMHKRSWKRRLGAVLSAAILFFTVPAGLVAAEGNIWMDENLEIPASRYKKVVVFPIRYPGEMMGDYEHDPAYNTMLLKRLNKRGKGVNWFGFSPMLEEKSHILRDNPKYEALLKPFVKEKDRADAVFDATAADGYLLPCVRWDHVRVDHSPATWTMVRMESYVDIKNGEHGNQYKLHHRTWYENHRIPAHDSELRMLDVDFSLIDSRTGRKSLTLVDYYRNYECDKEHAFNQIFKNFAGDWSRQRNDKKQSVRAGAPTLGFRNLNLLEEAGNNEFSVKTIYYAYKDAAEDKLKGVQVVPDADTARYYVTGTIESYQRGETWHPPTASSYTSLDHTDTYDWYDSDGKKHTAEKKYYRSEISDSYGYYSFWYHVAANLRLVDAITGQTVFENHYDATDPDRFGNALRSVFNGFYRDVDDQIGEKK